MQSEQKRNKNEKKKISAFLLRFSLEESVVSASQRLRWTFDNWLRYPVNYFTYFCQILLNPVCGKVINLYSVVVVLLFLSNKTITWNGVAFEDRNCLDFGSKTF